MIKASLPAAEPTFCKAPGWLPSGKAEYDAPLKALRGWDI